MSRQYRRYRWWHLLASYDEFHHSVGQHLIASPYCLFTQMRTSYGQNQRDRHRQTCEPSKSTSLDHCLRTRESMAHCVRRKLKPNTGCVDNPSLLGMAGTQLIPNSQPQMPPKQSVNRSYHVYFHREVDDEDERSQCHGLVACTRQVWQYYDMDAVVSFRNSVPLPGSEWIAFHDNVLARVKRFDA